jgi:hypothetical protein
MSEVFPILCVTHFASKEHHHPAWHTSISDVASRFVPVTKYLDSGTNGDHQKKQQPCYIPNRIDPQKTPAESNRSQEKNPEDNARNPASVFSIHASAPKGAFLIAS